jgi:nitrate reductase beta subunit
MFGPGVEAARNTYRSASKDPDLAGLLCLFGSTESIIHRWSRQGETINGMDEKGATLVRVPLTEPVHIRAAYDPKFRIVRTNCP